MGIDASADSALRRRIQLQGHLWSARHPILNDYREPDRLWRDIRVYLKRASDRRVIATPVKELNEIVLVADAPDEVAASVKTPCFSLQVGQGRNFDRTTAHPHVKRREEGWFDFCITVTLTDQGLELVAYDFEFRTIELPFGWIRFDLNPPSHEGDKLGLRSHAHLGRDDEGLRIPVPVMTPFEILDLFLFGVRSSGNGRWEIPAGLEERVKPASTPLEAGLASE